MWRVPRVSVLILLAFAPGLNAQREPLRARMDAFMAAMGDLQHDSLVPFLPRHGEWTWVVTTRFEGRGDRVGQWRFSAEDLVRAAEDGGPLCPSLTAGGDVMPTGTLIAHAIREEGPWRRVSATRFVPPGASARSPVFVEWRREDGRWVLSAFGDTRRGGPRLLGWARNEIIPARAGETEPPPDAVYVGEREWFRYNMPIQVAGRSLDRYGIPRSIPRDLLAYYGRVDGVPVYHEVGVPGVPEVVYLPVEPGMYHPYQAMTGSACSPVRG